MSSQSSRNRAYESGLTVDGIMRIMDNGRLFKVFGIDGGTLVGKRLDAVPPEWDEDGFGYVSILTHPEERWGEVMRFPDIERIEVIE